MWYLGHGTLAQMQPGQLPRAESIDPAVLRQLERWFVSKGVPQFIEGYSSEQRMDARAAPLIAAWIVVWTVLLWASHGGLQLGIIAVGIIGSLAFVAVSYALVSWFRGRSIGSLPAKFDLFDIALFALLPSVPAAVLAPARWDAVWSFLNVLLGIGIIYIVIGFGLLELALWALKQLRTQLVHIVSLLARTLPVLLILVVFLLFAVELWQVAHSLHLIELVALLGLMLLIAGLLIVTTFRPEIQRLDAWDDWDALLDDARQTPAEPLTLVVRRPTDGSHPLGWLQRRNLDFLVLVNQLLQSVFVALLVMAFLVAFGLLALPASVQEGWIGEAVNVVTVFELLGEPRTVSAELLTVSALLSAIVGLYFTGLALTDATYRAEHFTLVVAELRSLNATRTVYLAALRLPALSSTDSP